SSTRMLDGELAGRNDAAAARKLADVVHMPKGRPIYFCCDTEASGSSVLPYLEGAQTELGSGAVGVYGGIAVIEAAYAHGVRYLFQTAAWSGGRWSAHAQLRQRVVNVGHGPAIDGVQVDLDESRAADFGQW